MSNTIGDLSIGPGYLSDTNTSVSTTHAVLSTDTFASMSNAIGDLSIGPGYLSDTTTSVSTTHAVVSTDTCVSANSGACVSAYATMSHNSLSGDTAAAMRDSDDPQLSGTFGASRMSANLGSRMPVAGRMPIGSGLRPWAWQSRCY